MGEGTADDSLQRACEAMVSADVVPFLRARGFDVSGSSFERERGPLYDIFNFQADRHNGTMSWRGFFVNVGVGSAELGATIKLRRRSPGNADPRLVRRVGRGLRMHARRIYYFDSGYIQVERLAR
jgi:hypothetical protein